MRRYSTVIGLALTIITGGAALAAEDTAALLQRQTQEMLDAVTAGDAKVWDKYVDPDIVYISEAGERETKDSLVKQITPLPKDISGKITISRFETKVFGDTAVTLHVDEESEDYFGHALTAQYWNTNTWHKARGGWRLIGGQVYATLFEPPAIPLPANKLADYEGAYRLNDEITYEIRRDGDELVGQRNGRPQEDLRVEAADVMFVPGQLRVRKIFQRDARGHITGFASRREGHDVIWSKVK